MGLAALLSLAGAGGTPSCSTRRASASPAAAAKSAEGTAEAGSVRQQMAVCAFWPKSRLPDGFAAPVRVDVPTLVLSGTIDPVTSPRWGEEAERHLPRALHLVVPGAHGLDDPCIESIRQAFLANPDVAALDTGCIEAVELPPFELGD